MQHDVWVRKAGDNQRLFAIHANDYLVLATAVVDMARPGDGGRDGDAVEAAMAFAAKVSHAYTIEDLDKLAEEIDRLGKLLFKALLYRIRLRCVGERAGRSP